MEKPLNSNSFKVYKFLCKSTGMNLPPKLGVSMSSVLVLCWVGSGERSLEAVGFDTRDGMVYALE